MVGRRHTHTVGRMTEPEIRRHLRSHHKWTRLASLLPTYGRALWWHLCDHRSK